MDQKNITKYVSNIRPLHESQERNPHYLTQEQLWPFQLLFFGKLA
jgi:hypothetical protein